LLRTVFELVSAFGGIGLSLGIPTENFAFSGAFSPLSKLVVIVIMVRGRHRGLPVAIDRASKCGLCVCYLVLTESQVLLPEDLVSTKHDDSVPADTTHLNGLPPSNVSELKKINSKESHSHQMFQDTEKGQ
jgi:hypothetical protein